MVLSPSSLKKLVSNKTLDRNTTTWYSADMYINSFYRQKQKF